MEQQGSRGGYHKQFELAGVELVGTLAGNALAGQRDTHNAQPERPRAQTFLTGGSSAPIPFRGLVCSWNPAPRVILYRPDCHSRENMQRPSTHFQALTCQALPVQLVRLLAARICCHSPSCLSTLEFSLAYLGFSFYPGTLSHSFLHLHLYQHSLW